MVNNFQENILHVLSDISKSLQSISENLEKVVANNKSIQEGSESSQETSAKTLKFENTYRGSKDHHVQTKSNYDSKDISEGLKGLARYIRNIDQKIKM